MPDEVSEEELGFPLVPMGQCLLSLKLQDFVNSSPSASRKSTSSRSSHCSSKRNSFKAGLCSDHRKSISRKSSFKRSRPSSLSVPNDNDNSEDWEWVWETDEDECNEENKIEEKLNQVTEIIAKPEEKWRRTHRTSTPGSSGRSSYCQRKGTITAQVGVEENDPLAMVKVASAKQWKNISRKLTINFDDLEQDQRETTPKPTLMSSIRTPLEEAYLEAKNLPIVPQVSVEEFDTPDGFKPTTVQELRRICWQVKPWDQPNRKTFAERQLFTSMLGTPWGVDADEVYSRILVGDQAAARNIAFLKRYGITHVLNAAEGPWTEHCVDLSAEHYRGSGITYLVRIIYKQSNLNIQNWEFRAGPATV